MKKIVIYMIVLFFMIFLPTNVMAAGTMDDVLKSGNTFLDSSSQTPVIVDKDKLDDASSMIYGILQYVGMGLSVIIGAILGIKIMISSAEEKAKVKEALVPYIIGCFVIFGAFAFWKMAVQMYNSIF